MEQDIWILYKFVLQGVCTEAGMYALRERRVHVTQEDFEMAVAKVLLVDMRDKRNTQYLQLPSLMSFSYILNCNTFSFDSEYPLGMLTV